MAGFAGLPRRRPLASLPEPGALGKALESFRKIVETAPPDPSLIARSRQYLSAIERKGRSEEFQPQNADDHYLHGVLLLNDGDPSAALDAFAWGLGARDDAHASARYRRDLVRRLGRRAIEEVRDALPGS